LVVAKGVAQFRPVSLGLRDGQRAAVLEGVKEGEMVIVNPAGVEPGKQVRAEIKTGGAKKK
jgi:hypothetical protein